MNLIICQNYITFFVMKVKYKEGNLLLQAIKMFHYFIGFKVQYRDHNILRLDSFLSH
jgi:hypothetical protein